MVQLRSKIQKIQQSDLTFEEKGQQLYSVITESHRSAAQPKDEAASSTASRKGLPPREIIQPRLTELPVELIENVAIRLDLPSLKDFRLSCNTLKAKSGHYFRRRFFTTRVVRPEWDSLRTLMMILNGDLGSTVRDIVIDAHAQDRRSPGYRPLAAPIRSRGVPYSSRQLSRVSSTNSRTSSQHLSMLFGRTFEKIGFLRSLSFRAFKMSSQVPILYSKECSVNVLEETFKALALSATSISSLTLGTGRSHDYDAWFRLVDLHTEILTADKNLARVFRNIHTMTLGLGVGNPPTGIVSEFPSKLLNMTPNLKNLELAIGSHSSPDCLAAFTDIAASTSLTKLVKVDLCSMELTTQSLRTFLSASVGTMRKVQVIDVEMRENPDEALKTYLKDELALDEARLKNLFTGVQVWIADARLVGGAWTLLSKTAVVG